MVASSVAAVHDDLFYFCSTIKYRNFCFFLNPLAKGKININEARGRINPRETDSRRHTFVFEGKLNIVSVNSQQSLNVNIQTMDDRSLDWTQMSYEDPLWKHSFKNESHAVYLGSTLISAPYDTIMNDFYPIPDRKGDLFVATFRWREFEAGRHIMVDNTDSYLSHEYENRMWTKAEYFIIVYRYVAGRFIRIGLTETNFRAGYVRKPYFKDINGFETSLK